MQDLEILAVAKTYTKETVIGMGALKGAPCTVQGVVDAGDGTQTLTLKWTDDNGVAHTTDISLPSAIFEITSPSNGQTLRYNSTSGKFENSNVSFSADLGDLDDVVLTSVQDGQVLIYDAANNRWINADGSTVGDLSDLDDVVISTVQNGQYLVYDGTNHKWVNATLEINASDVGYDNTTSGLSATDAQGAIDEIALNVSQLSASKIGYDGTASGLSADKVQGAIDELADEKVDKETGKGLSANDFTDTLKNKLDGIEENAEENDIDTIKVNGTALTPQNKAVDILLNMTKLSDVDLTGLSDEMILIYDATNNKWYAGANTGATYTAGEGIEIDQNNKISSKIVLFTGTEAQWNALPLADKIKFTHYATNDDQTGQIDPVPTQNSNNLMTSGGIYTALQDKANTSDLGTAAAKDSTNAVTAGSSDLVESGAVDTAITSAIEALDVSDTAVAGSYVTEVSETDGKVSVTREAADATPTASSNKMVKSGGLYTALLSKTTSISKNINLSGSGDIYAFLEKCVDAGILIKDKQMSFTLTQIYDSTHRWTFTDLNNFQADRCTIEFDGYYHANSSDNASNTFSVTITSWDKKLIYYYFEDRPNYGGPHSWRTVSENPYYSTSESFTGKYWIDGKPIYKKVINFGTLPNATVKTVDPNISSLGRIVKLEGVAYSSNNTVCIPLPFAEPYPTENYVSLYYYNGDIAVRTGTDRSNYSLYAILEYTKTTD